MQNRKAFFNDWNWPDTAELYPLTYTSDPQLLPAIYFDFAFRLWVSHTNHDTNAIT